MVINAWFSSLRAAQGEEVLGGPTSLMDPAAERATPSLEAGLAFSSEDKAAFDAGEGINDSLSTASLKGTIAANSGQGPVATVAVAKPTKIASASDLDDKAPAPKPQPAPSRYFIQPASGINWGILHSGNAVDIANACGTAIVAAAGGVVLERETGWNSGYGNYILLEHPNGVKTRYAHMKDMYAKVGEAVNQGAQIGTIGNTGQVVGVTGCHVHFEVIGMKNPFAKR